MPHTIECPRCAKVGLVRLETVIRGNDFERQYQCGRCSYAWHERDMTAAADRRRSTQRRPIQGDRRRSES